MLTYAIADLHGRSDLLDAILAKIGAHRPGEPHRLVFLGDYIDRGPDSAGVIATLRDLQTIRPLEVTCLRGNHEQMLLDALRTNDDELWAHWMMNGGEATLASFEAAYRERMDPDVMAWLNALPLVSEDAQRYYVHAGFHPGRTAPQDEPRTCLWIREPFLTADHDFGKHVVHGHTPQAEGPEVRRHRTNLDVGAFFTGRLVAGVFTDDQGPAIEILEVRGDA